MYTPSGLFLRDTTWYWEERIVKDFTFSWEPGARVVLVIAKWWHTLAEEEGRNFRKASTRNRFKALLLPRPVEDSIVSA